jgi:LysR family carnitine catabolism transcriptional activator
MTNRLTLPQLGAFLQLAELGGFRDAASALGVSQPALSRTIQQIETRLGARLFDRDTRTVSLTPAGKTFLPLAKRLIKEYDSAFKEFDDFVAGQSGRIRIAALPSVAAALLPAVIAAFQKCHPSVRIDIWEDVALPVHRAVAEGAADFGLAMPPQTQAGLTFKPMVKDEIVLVCRADDPLAQKDEYDWSVFEGRPYIGMSPESDLQRMVTGAFVQAGLSIEPLYNCKHLTTIGSLITASLGISALPRLTVAQLALPVLTWRRLRNPAMARSIGVITRTATSLSPPAALFLKELKAHAKLLVPRR